MTEIDTLIHLGAGPCRELDKHLSSQPKRLFLVEADPHLAEALLARTQELAQVRVIPSAVAAQSRVISFHRYNLPDAGSPHLATGLHDLFPGLKLQQTLSLEAIGLGEWIDSLDLTPEGWHRLILDLPGQEMTALIELEEHGQLQVFQWLDLHCGHQPLYEQAVAAETILAWLEERGFNLVERDESEDPDQPRWIFRRNPMVQALKAATAEAEKQAKAAAAHKAEAEKQAQLVARNNSEAQQQTQALEQAQAEVQRHSQLAGERAEQLKQSTQAQEKAQARIEELTQALETARAESAKQAQQAAQHKAEAEKQAKAAAAHKAEAEKQAQLVARNNSEAQQQTQALEQAQAEVQRHSQLAGERAEQLKQSTQAQEQAQARIEELTQALETARAESAKQAQQAAQHKAEAEKQAKAAAAHKAEAEKQAQCATERAEELRERDQTYAALVRDNAVALRLQQLRETDLKDLQQRHAEVVAQKNQQETLLKQLTERLTAASGYLHQLEQVPDQPAAAPDEQLPQSSKKQGN